jgi:hypothetical protein
MRHTRFSQRYQPASPTLEVTEKEMINRAEATAWRCHTLAEVQMVDGRVQPCQAVVDRAAQASRKAPVQIPTSFMRCDSEEPTVDLQQIHHGNICRSLAHRIQMAQQQGNSRLLRALQAELLELSIC